MVTSFSAWKNKYQIIVTNPPATAGFQASFVVSFLPGMRSDFRDIRFSDKYGNPLYHYQEYYTSFVSAKFWVKLPALDTHIFMYYGNGQVSSGSDGNNTFEFFDDFSSSSVIDTAKWNTYGNVAISSEQAKLGYPSSSLSSYISSITTWGEGYNVIVRALLPQQRGQFDAAGFVQFSGHDLYRAVAWTTYQTAPKTSLWWYSYTDRTLTDDFSNAYHIFELQRKGSGKSRLIIDGTTIIDDQAGSFTSALSVGARSFDYNSYVYVDYIFVVKYSATEPVLTLGTKYVAASTGFLSTNDFLSDSVTVYISVEHDITELITDAVTVAVSAVCYLGVPDPVTDTLTVSISIDHEIVDRDELSDYSLISIDISKSITDIFMQLSATFADDTIPDENKTVIYNRYDTDILYRIVASDEFRILTLDGFRVGTYDGLRIVTSDGVSSATVYDYYIVTSDDFRLASYADTLTEQANLMFLGKVISKTPVLSSIGNSASLLAADNSRNLSMQYIPWIYQIVSLSNPLYPGMDWATWIWYLLDSSKTGVVRIHVIEQGMPDKQFAFDPKTTVWDAIKQICDYCGLIINIKLRTVGYLGADVVLPGFYAVPADQIDQLNAGFDLPTPVTFSYPDPNIIDEPQIEYTQDEIYNKVTVYGILSDTGETTVASAYTPPVSYGGYTGGDWAKEFRIQDNNIFEKGSTAEIEAIKWLLYFSTRRAKVTFQMAGRFDLELYQRIKFGPGYGDLEKLTNSAQLAYVVAYDPRDEYNSTHTVDVSGVPCPRWLRVSSVKYHGAVNEETFEVEAITDFIYASSDPLIPAPYSSFISPGYIKPVESDSVSTIYNIIDSRIQKQLKTDYGTILSKNEDGKTVVVQTTSGSILTVIAQNLEVGINIVIIPDGKGSYYGVQPG